MSDDDEKDSEGEEEEQEEEIKTEEPVDDGPKPDTHYWKLYKDTVTNHNERKFKTEDEEYESLRYVFFYLRHALFEKFSHYEYVDITKRIDENKPHGFTLLGVLVNVGVCRFVFYHLKGIAEKNAEKTEDNTITPQKSVEELLHEKSKYIVFDKQTAYNFELNETKGLKMDYTTPCVIAIRNGNYKMLKELTFNHKIENLDVVYNEFTDDKNCTKKLDDLEVFKFSQFCHKRAGTDPKTKRDIQIRKAAELCYKIKMFNFQNLFTYFLSEINDYKSTSIFDMAKREGDIETYFNFIKSGYDVTMKELRGLDDETDIGKRLEMIILMMFYGGTNHTVDDLNTLTQKEDDDTLDTSIIKQRVVTMKDLKYYRDQVFSLKDLSRWSLRVYIRNLPQFKSKLFWHVFDAYKDITLPATQLKVAPGLIEYFKMSDFNPKDDNWEQAWVQIVKNTTEVTDT